MEKRISGIDKLDLKQINKEFIEKTEKIYDKNERIAFLKSQLKKLEPSEEIQHMFVDENALSSRSDHKPKS